MAFKALKTLAVGSVVLLGLVGGTAIASASGGGNSSHDAKHRTWGFNSLFGGYDREAAQRGYQVYREVCSSCHALEHLDFRHLGDEGAPFWNADYPNPNENPIVKAFAADWDISDIDSDNGDIITRPGTPADSFPSIYPNPAAARASNGGALPPDLSVMTKARNNGPDYVYNLLTSYDLEMPEGMKMSTGQSYNPVMEGSAIAMAAPLSEGLVEYEGDHAPEATVEQMSADIVEFLAWSADPKLEQRKRAGFGTMIYLLLLSVLLYLSYKRVWRHVAH